ncbi:MAG: type II secretion system protein [Lentisphaerae bacterium]|jgi:prepilin-type processing-associated H-X9-DG protein|nr:type II secretion system protein [Lentisphaerota bacterium]MBT4816576.1 type II secretion system protein [Lentisphaerota bacterium]MBT5608454.1 type II secretion system protein [Lentisphaerota bacterium]MBT7055145.1 type II secretion system protein [Lentisphaerota bacterium]MBT7841291.1 type II secretion system protein [Lentisphaerota bacterium]
MSRRRTRYWTLIELLVTIGIIAMLAAFLLPALKRSRDSARMMKCRNHLKNIITANFLYMDDYDEVWAQGNNGTGTYCWFAEENSLGSYLGAVRTANDTNSAQIMRCPSAPTPWYSFTRAGAKSRWYVAYGYNNHIGSNNRRTAVKVNEVKHPDKTIVFCDALVSWFSKYPGEFDDRNTSQYDPAGNFANRYYRDTVFERHGGEPSLRHFKGANIAFADGHAGYSKDFVMAKNAKKLTLYRNPRTKDKTTARWLARPPDHWE